MKDATFDGDGSQALDAARRALRAVEVYWKDLAKGVAAFEALSDQVEALADQLDGAPIHHDLIDEYEKRRIDNFRQWLRDRPRDWPPVHRMWDLREVEWAVQGDKVLDEDRMKFAVAPYYTKRPAYFWLKLDPDHRESAEIEIGRLKKSHPIAVISGDIFDLAKKVKIGEISECEYSTRRLEMPAYRPCEYTHTEKRLYKKIDSIRFPGAKDDDE